MHTIVNSSTRSTYKTINRNDQIYDDIIMNENGKEDLFK